MTWLTATRAVLAAYKTASGISYYWRRCEAATDQLPDRYIVYFLVSDPPKGHSDNIETSHIPRVQVSFYFKDKADYLTYPAQIEAAFMAANFLRVTSDELPYDTDTGHYGWYVDFRFYERR